MAVLQRQAVLFDLDGVLVSSGASVNRSWTEWARARGLDPEPVLERAHGQRSVDTIRQSAPDLDAHAQAERLESRQALDLAGVGATAGARELLERIPAERWAIVTSGSRQLATARLRWTGLPVPDVLVTGDDVRRGKPDAEGYRQAASRLGYEPAACAVVEDSAAGLAAAAAAGSVVVAVTPHAAAEDASSPFGPVLSVRSLAELCVRVDGDGLHLARAGEGCACPR